MPAFGTADDATRNAVRIPPIWCPLPLHTRSGAEKFQQRTEQLYQDMGFDSTSMNTVREICAGELACMWAAMGDEEGVQLLSDWLPWPFLFDDAYCDGGPLSRDPTAFNHRAMRLMYTAICPEQTSRGPEFVDLLSKVLTEIMGRVRSRAEEGVSAVALAHYRWALGAACGVSDRSTAYVRSLDEHMIVRPADGADLMCLYLTEIAEGTWYTPAATSDPAIRAITDAASVAFSVLTDLGSYGHEGAQNSLESNIVHVIANERGISVQDAMHEACALMEEIMELFARLKNRLSHQDDPRLQRYLQQLSNFVRGALEWQRRLPRYARFSGRVEPLIATGQLLSDPIHELSEHRIFPKVEPPPSIRWWWDFV